MRAGDANPAQLGHWTQAWLERIKALYAAHEELAAAWTSAAAPAPGQADAARLISLDNNVSERALRQPVVTRKNAYGSRNDDAARVAATIWTVTATAEMAGLNVLTYLTAHLDACGRNGSKPLTRPDLERFLPWNASPADLRTWAQPPRPG